MDLDAHEHLLAAGGLETFGLDVKYYSYCLDQHSLPYGFRHTLKAATKDVAVYVLAFENVDQHVAIVPKEVWDVCSDFGYEDHPLLLQIMAWCVPFMVHVRHLKAAAGNIIEARNGNWYINPTTRVMLKGWILSSALQPPEWQPQLFPDHTDERGIDRRHAFVRAITNLWKVMLAFGHMVTSRDLV